MVKRKNQGEFLKNFAFPLVNSVDFQFWQVLSYSDDGDAAECEFISGRVAYNNHDHAYFKMNYDNVLSSGTYTEDGQKTPAKTKNRSSRKTGSFC